MGETVRIRIPHERDVPKFPYFSNPKHIGEYTVARDRHITVGRADAKYLVNIPPDGMDLNLGFESWEQKSGEEERLDVLLEWICSQAPKGGTLKKVLHETDMVSWRGLLTRIGITPFATRDSWCFHAMRKENVIFLCEKETEDAKIRKARMTMRDKVMTYWGFKFEQYMTADTPQATPNTNEPVSCLEEFSTVVMTNIHPLGDRPRIRLLYSGEVDALDNEGELVEMKTHRRAMEGGFWRHKSLKWWMQSFLVGIKDIVVGLRDDDGKVLKVESVSIDRLAREGQWSAAVVIAFLAEVLDAVRKALPDNHMACQISYNPAVQADVVVSPLPKDTNFLSEEFCRHFQIEVAK